MKPKKKVTDRWTKFVQTWKTKIRTNQDNKKKRKERPRGLGPNITTHSNVTSPRSCPPEYPRYTRPTEIGRREESEREKREENERERTSKRERESRRARRTATSNRTDKRCIGSQKPLLRRVFERGDWRRQFQLPRAPREGVPIFRSDALYRSRIWMCYKNITSRSSCIMRVTYPIE